MRVAVFKVHRCSIALERYITVTHSEKDTMFLRRGYIFAVVNRMDEIFRMLSLEYVYCAVFLTDIFTLKLK